MIFPSRLLRVEVGLLFVYIHLANQVFGHERPSGWRFKTKMPDCGTGLLNGVPDFQVRRIRRRGCIPRSRNVGETWGTRLGPLSILARALLLGVVRASTTL